MRQKRAKAYKRVMALYTSAFGFRQPYQVLMNSDFLLEAGKQTEVDCLKIVERTVQGDTKPMITQCCIEALYRLGKEYQPVVDLAKKCERRKCNHRTAIEPFECIKSVVGDTNKHRYILALQSPKLASSLHHIPGLPVIHYNARGVMVLSPPSTATVRAKNAVEEERRLEGAKVLEGVEDGANVVGVGAAETRRKKAKGPNPLSVKKKKAEPQEGKTQKRKLDEEEPEPEPEAQAEEDAGRRKKKRRRGRGKGVVAATIAEIKAGGLGGVISQTFESATAAGGGDESD